MTKKKLTIALTSTFASIATIGVVAGIITQLNSKDNSVNVVTNSYVIKDRLSSEVLLNNTVLNLLNNNINKFIQSNKLSFDDLKNNLLDDSKLDEFKSNLVKWSNNVLSLESIGDIKLINDNDSIKLIVNSNDMYQFNSTNDSPYFDSNNSSLVFENLNLYNDIYFNNKNISDFKSQLQHKINLEKFTLADFIKFIKSDQFIDFVLENLKTSQGTFIESMIGDISFDDKTNELLIGGSDIYKIILDNESVQNIVISDLQFFEDVKLSISSTLHKSLQEIIDNEKFTSIQYENYIKDNKVIIKELLSKNLYIDKNQLISIDEIKDISFKDNNLLVDLNSDSNKKYSIDGDINFSLINNKIVIKNLRCWDSINFVNLSKLYEAVENIIVQNKLTKDEFKLFISDNSISFKETLVQNLFISENSNIHSSLISNINFDNNGTLNIQLASMDHLKYEMKNSENISLKDNILSIKNLKYYNVVDLINIDNLNKAIQDEINKKSFTAIEFKDYLQTSGGLESIKYVISQKLDTSSDSKLNQSNISLVEFNGNNLEITLSSIEYTKYNMESLEYAILLDNKIILNNLDFFEEVIIKEYRMQQLWEGIQELISRNGFSRNEFEYIIRQDVIRHFLTNLVDMYLHPYSYNSIIDYKLFVIDSYYSEWNNELGIMFMAPDNYNIKINVKSSYLFRAEGNTLVFSNLYFLR